MIGQIRGKLNNYIGEEVTIKELYENVFLVELKNNSKRSFTYTNVITKTIKIDY